MYLYQSSSRQSTVCGNVENMQSRNRTVYGSGKGETAVATYCELVPISIDPVVGAVSIQRLAWPLRCRRRRLEHGPKSKDEDGMSATTNFTPVSTLADLKSSIRMGCWKDTWISRKAIQLAGAVTADTCTDGET